MNTNRGSKHFIYINRTFFGLYHMMHALRPTHIVIDNYKKFYVQQSDDARNRSCHRNGLGG